MNLKRILASVIFAGVLCSQTQVALCCPALLWDINYDGREGGLGSIADFTALGISENLTGAIVSQVIASTNSTMTDGTISLSYASGSAFNVIGETSANAVLTDYLYLQQGAHEGPVNFQLSGLSSLLVANTTYSFYLIGAGNTVNQGSAFLFDGVTKLTTSAATAPEAAAKFSFTTTSTVTDTLDFTWSRIGDNTYGAINGFAIAAIPEPATFGLMGVFGYFLIIARRRTVASFEKPEQE